MPETLSKTERSRVMAAVKSRDTRPELLVRRLLHTMGFRFRLHRRDLPGTPDIVLPKYKKVINVHGCFWHMHQCRHGRVNPVKRANYWLEKRRRNARRDRQVVRELRRLGWQVLTLWECDLKDPSATIIRLKDFLGPSRHGVQLTTHRNSRA